MSAEEIVADFFVKIRKVCEMELMRLKPPDSEKFVCFDPESIGWVRSRDQNDFFEQYPAFRQKPVPSFDYISLLRELKKRDGKFVCNGFFYWLKEDMQTIVRRFCFC